MRRSTHYETLGLKPTATEGEVKAAYRRIALRHHPDRNPDPASTRLFMEATEAYDVLIDGPERRRYDVGLEAEDRRTAEREAEAKRQTEADARVRRARSASTAPSASKTATPGSNASTPPRTGAPVPTQLARLSMLFSRGLYAEAEKLADEIVRIAPREALPYAVRGDLARQRGKMDEAARQYSLAIQMDPRNPTYLRRYEEVLERAQIHAGDKGGARLDPNDRGGLSLLALLGVSLLGAAYLILSPERADLKLGPLGDWSIGLVAMLFLGGVASGACLAVGDLLDRLDAYAAGRLGPTVALGLIALVSFPAAAILYVLLGLLQRGFNLTTSRLLAAVASVVLLLAVASALSSAQAPLVSVLLWGGNLAYLGALCGWAVADSLRR